MSANFRPNPIAGKNPEALEALEDESRGRLHGWWDLLGEPAEYPAATDTVVRLLRKVDYDASNDLVLTYVNEGIIPSPPHEHGRMAWYATHIVTLAAALEARRKWVPLSAIHGHKATLAERLSQTAGIVDLPQFDLDALLAMLIQVSHDAGAVQALAEAIRQKVRQQETGE